MHSSHLRGSDFLIEVEGGKVEHAAFFEGVGKMRRLGLVAPRGVDGVGAVTLVMAYMTAFYDAYRADGGEFFAYPDYFAFQSQSPLAAYTMLDIWPEHKNVQMGVEPVDRLNAINDRGVNVLILPEGKPFDNGFERPQLESARRNIEACYLYAFDGQVSNADVVMRCAREPLFGWAMAVFESVGEVEMRAAWVAMWEGKEELVQGFRRVGLDEALLHL